MRDAGQQRAGDEQRADHERGVVEPFGCGRRLCDELHAEIHHAGRVSDRELRDLRVTVLGKSPSWQDAGGACSGYLVEEDGTTVLLDCGNGVFSKLRRFRDYVDVDAVAISHLHADHFLDLVPYSYALTYAPRQQPVPIDPWPGTDNPARPRLIAPSGAGETFRRVVGAWGNDDLIENAFALEEYEPNATVEVDALRFSFQEVPHFTETFAINVSSANGGGRFTFGADCSPCDALVEIARDTDLLIVEAT